MNAGDWYDAQAEKARLLRTKLAELLENPTANHEAIELTRRQLELAEYLGD